MASRIQGITVEIGGDTTKLSKALESVNKSIKGTQSGLKDVNKLLKLDPSNTELVVQKTLTNTSWNGIKTVITTACDPLGSAERRTLVCQHTWLPWPGKDSF